MNIIEDNNEKKKDRISKISIFSKCRAIDISQQLKLATPINYSKTWKIILHTKTSCFHMGDKFINNAMNYISRTVRIHHSHSTEADGTRQTSTMTNIEMLSLLQVIRFEYSTIILDVTALITTKMTIHKYYNPPVNAITRNSSQLCPSYYGNKQTHKRIISKTAVKVITVLKA